MKSDIKTTITNLAPLAGLVILFIAFIAIGTVKDINIPYSFKTIINQSVVVAVIATGAVFIYTLGSFDISLGASAAVSALTGGMAYLATENIWVMLLVSMGVAIGVSLVNSVLASVFNLPVFVTTIAMLSVLNAVVLLLISLNGTGSEIAVPAAAVSALDTMGFKIAVLVVYVLFCVFLFEFTPIGRKEKFLGGNALCAKLTGISLSKFSIIGFVIAGVGVGLGAFLSIVYAPTLTKNTASSVGMDVILAIVFGGMPVSGGAKSKIYAAVVGAFSMTILGQILTVLNYNSGISQVVKAAIFLVVVKLASGTRTQTVLPR